MHVILGGTGRVGSATAGALLAQGEPVTVVTRDPFKGMPWKRRGAEIAVADVRDVDALRGVLKRGKRLFLLNPPADPSTDTEAEERRTVRSIVSALAGSGLEGIVALSTYAAQPGERCGDLNILHEMEEALRAQPIPTCIIRAAFYMSNWDAALPAAREDGVISTFYPSRLKIPMVAPKDLGRVAARLLTDPAESGEIRYVEGPERYSSTEVAAAFAAALGRPVRLAEIPRDEWLGTFKRLGFSEPAAESYARMTAISAGGAYEIPDAPIRGRVSLREYIASLVDQERSTKR